MEWEESEWTDKKTQYTWRTSDIIRPINRFSPTVDEEYNFNNNLGNLVTEYKTITSDQLFRILALPSDTYHNFDGEQTPIFIIQADEKNEKVISIFQEEIQYFVKIESDNEDSILFEPNNYQEHPMNDYVSAEKFVPQQKDTAVYFLESGGQPTLLSCSQMDAIYNLFQQSDIDLNQKKDILMNSFQLKKNLVYSIIRYFRKQTKPTAFFNFREGDAIKLQKISYAVILKIHGILNVNQSFKIQILNDEKTLWLTETELNTLHPRQAVTFPVDENQSILLLQNNGKILKQLKQKFQFKNAWIHQRTLALYFVDECGRGKLPEMLRWIEEKTTKTNFHKLKTWK